MTNAICHYTRSKTAKIVRLHGMEFTTTTLIVETHTSGAETAWLTIEGRNMELPVEEAAKLFDKFPGTRVRLVNMPDECCEDADHQEDMLDMLALENIDPTDIPAADERARLDAAFGSGRFAVDGNDHPQSTEDVIQYLQRGQLI